MSNQPPPADVSGNSIGDLNDVVFDILTGEVEIEGLNKLYFKNGGFSSDDAAWPKGYLGYYLKDVGGNDDYRGLTLRITGPQTALVAIHVDRIAELNSFRIRMLRA